MDTAHPKSILELLTHPNPATVHRKLQSDGNTSYSRWYTPKRIIKWTDFQDLHILKKSFNGRLYEEACREREGFRCLPEIFDQEKFIASETEVRDLIVRWSKAVVLAGHKPIAEEFHPLLWAKGNRPDAKDPMPAPSPPKAKRVTQVREVSIEAKRRRTLHGRVGIPDSGAISPSANDSESGNTQNSRQERFPMEFEVGSKWKSEYLAPMLDKNGALKQQKNNNNHLMPIMQAYTYCIENLCRYGCIFTDRELFLFQISSLDGKPENVEDLKRHIGKNGKMEYVAIPYKNHCLDNFEAFDTWTINLAIWFMLILVAQPHELGWSYRSLRDFPVGSADCEGLPVIDGETRESNDIARQEVEEREEGEVDENGGGVGAVSGPNDSEGTISGSDTSRGTGAGSEDPKRTELDSKIAGTKLRRSQRRTKKRKSKG